MGVWSEGIYIAPTTSRRSSESSTVSQKYLEKPKLDLNKIFDNTEEKKLKNALKDDLIDDDDDLIDGAESFDEKMDPFLLPKIKKSEDIHKYINNEENDSKPIISANGQGNCKSFENNL